MKAVRTSKYCCTLIAALWLCVNAAHAADAYPSKAGRLILPFGAGGSTDVVGRVFAQQFSEAWGQTLVIDNR
ncbi:MAG: putative tricarboxylic transport rane protein, partial [Betaproteobacteria bacterium]|nr:putative tricarboxylic transport rane protein [Betaproteobacteria bacterium]